MDENCGIKAMLSTVRNGYDDQIESLNVFKSQARTVFSSSSIIISLVSVLQIFSTIPEGFKGLFQAIIAGIIILYIVLVVLSLIVLSPAAWTTPVKLDWDILASYFGEENERNTILKETSAYLGAIDENRKTVIERRRMTLWQGIIFGVIVILVIIAGVLPHLIGIL